MHPQHKAVKVQPLFTRARQAMVEEIHQPGFPPTNAAPHIQAPHRRCVVRLALAQQFTKRRPQSAAGSGRLGTVRELLIEGLQPIDGLALDVVRLMAALF